MNKNSTISITLSEAKSALLRSGYLLESRIENLLSEKGYHVEANTVYPDPFTQKSREIDLLASRHFDKDGRFGSWVNATFLIECINNPQPIAFITKDVQYSPSLSENIKFNGLPLNVNQAFTIKNKKEVLNQSTVDFLEMNEYHHYCSEKIATQFCSFEKKKNQEEWMAFHNDIHFEALQKLSDATNYYIKLAGDNWGNSQFNTVNLKFFYPVIIVQGDLLSVIANRKRSLSLKKVNHIQFLRTAIQDKEAKTYQIDIIVESYLSSYLQIIQTEMDKTINRIQENIEALNNAIKEETEIKFI